jgi:hypothetical protein
MTKSTIFLGPTGRTECRSSIVGHSRGLVLADNAELGTNEPETVQEPFKSVYSDPVAACATCHTVHNVSDMTEIEPGAYACSNECFEEYFYRYVG